MVAPLNNTLLLISITAKKVIHKVVNNKQYENTQIHNLI